MAGFDLLSAIDPEYTSEVVASLMPETEPLAIRAFHEPERDVIHSTSGVSTFIPFDALMPESDHDTQIAFTAAPNPLDMKAEKSSWELNGKYSAQGDISRIDLVSMPNEMDVAGLHEKLIMKVLGQLAMKIDSNFVNGVLKETTVNLSYDVQTGGKLPWTDNGAELFTQIEDAMDLSKGVASDVLILGENVMRLLRRLTIFKETYTAIISADNPTPYERFRARMMEEFGLEVIVMDKNWIKTNVKGVTPAYAKLYDNIAFLGSKEHIRVKRYTAMDEFVTDEYDAKRQVVEAFGHRYVAFERLPERVGGVVFTNFT